MSELFKLKEQVCGCTRCDLHKTKKEYVFGEGNLNADIMFIGEAPGANEDIQGRPFVGRAGVILDEMLKAGLIKRNDIYIANILKCRPPQNRNPKPEEINLCTSYLRKQIDFIKPKVICPLGNFATKFILELYGVQSKIEGISKMHGKVFKITNLFSKIIVIPLYHPAVATYNPDMKSILIKDMDIVKREIK